MKTHALRTCLVSAVASTFLVAACPAVFAGMQITMEFSSTELPTHMMGAGGTGVDMWMLATPAMFPFSLGDSRSLTLSAMAPAGMWIQVDQGSGLSLTGMLLAYGTTPDQYQWVNTTASVALLGLQGAVLSTETARVSAEYSTNGMGFLAHIDNLQMFSEGPWSLTGINLTIDATGLQSPDPFSARANMTTSFIQAQDSGGPHTLLLPEPATLSLLALGGLGALLRRKK
jgi:hypothetical protein